MSFFYTNNKQKHLLKPAQFFYKKPPSVGFSLLTSCNACLWHCVAVPLLFEKQCKALQSKQQHKALQTKICIHTLAKVQFSENSLYGFSNKKIGHNSLYSDSRLCNTNGNGTVKRLVWEKAIESRRKFLGVAKPLLFAKQKKEVKALQSTNQNKQVTHPSFSPFFFFEQIFCPDFICRQNINTHMQISRVEKVSISYTGKSLVNSPTELVAPMAALELIAAQRCAVVWAIQSVSSWKLRKNSVIGCKVTLRGKSAALFLEKLYCYVFCVNISEKNSCFIDRYGNMHFGVSENKCFHELQKSSSLWVGFSGFSISITKTPVLPTLTSTSIVGSALQSQNIKTFASQIPSKETSVAVPIFVVTSLLKQKAMQQKNRSIYATIYGLPVL